MSLATHAQHLTHDFGVHVGLVSIQTDYGTRGDFLSMFGNIGAPAISGTYTMHFYQLNNNWNSDELLDYIAVRFEANLIPKTNLKHFGDFVDTNTDLGRELRAMTGTTQILSLGFQLEYYFFCLRDFSYPYSDMKWNPYMLAGLQFSAYNNSLNSTLGDWETDPTVLPTKWTPDFARDIGPGTTYAVTFGGGVRYNLNERWDLNIQGNWQFFLSDSVDGLTADVIENKNKEWLINFQIGMIYRFRL
jgi:opacity protein-like surface antigen